jgi:hypothetical protein
VISFPEGKRAYSIDNTFRAALVDASATVPDWLSEHLESEYPEVPVIKSFISKEAIRTGRKTKVSIGHSESLRVSKWLRWTAVRSRYLYIVANLIAGVMFPLLSRPSGENSYRSVLLVEFSN